jgi:hypothetical protein
VVSDLRPREFLNELWCFLGFPAADAEVRDFLTNKCDEATAMMRAHAFIAALFERTTTWVQRETPTTIEKIAENFRLYMTQNQEHNRPNEKSQILSGSRWDGRMGGFSSVVV